MRLGRLQAGQVALTDWPELMMRLRVPKMMKPRGCLRRCDIGSSCGVKAWGKGNGGIGGCKGKVRGRVVEAEREVPGKTAERICTAPIQTAWRGDMSSTRLTFGRVKSWSTAAMMMPPTMRAMAMTMGDSRFLPMYLSAK